jgi:hypothetical protein
MVMKKTEKRRYWVDQNHIKNAEQHSEFTNPVSNAIRAVIKRPVYISDYDGQGEYWTSQGNIKRFSIDSKTKTLINKYNTGKRINPQFVTITVDAE